MKSLFVYILTTASFVALADIGSLHPEEGKHYFIESNGVIKEVEVKLWDSQKRSYYVQPIDNNDPVGFWVSKYDVLKFAHKDQGVCVDVEDTPEGTYCVGSEYWLGRKAVAVYYRSNGTPYDLVYRNTDGTLARTKGYGPERKFGVLGVCGELSCVGDKVFVADDPRQYSYKTSLWYETEIEAVFLSTGENVFGKWKDYNFSTYGIRFEDGSTRELVYNYAIAKPKGCTADGLLCAGDKYGTKGAVVVGITMVPDQRALIRHPNGEMKLH